MNRITFEPHSQMDSFPVKLPAPKITPLEAAFDTLRLMYQNAAEENLRLHEMMKHTMEKLGPLASQTKAMEERIESFKRLVSKAQRANLELIPLSIIIKILNQ